LRDECVKLIMYLLVQNEVENGTSAKVRRKEGIE
jgi:hypothetical protein